MNKILSILLACTAAGAAYGAQETAQETGQAAKNVAIDSVVVTGARYASDIRHLPMSVAVVDRDEIVRRQEASVLPLLTEQVPGLFVTGRGVMGYGVSDGAAGGISLRGIGGGSAAQMLVLIDGHPQYMGLFGHPIADAYQSMLAERVEVVRGPASVLYGSNAMGGVINIVTRRQREEGVKTDLNVGYGSWNTLQTEAANRIRKGRFTSVVTGSYNRTDGHRADMGFEQYGGYAKVGYEISRRWNAYADVNLTHFNASNPGEITAPVFDNDSRITRGMASVSLENSYDRTSGALKFFYNWGRHRINDGYGAGEEPRDYRFNSKDRMLGVSWYQSAGLWRGSRLTAGIDWQRFGGRAWNRFTADVGAYKYGWRTGLLTALASPLVNAALFGMPAVTALPAILVKSALLAGAAGYAARRFNRVSVALLAAVVLFYQIVGSAGEWALTGSFTAAVQDFRIGIPGMLLQVFGGYLFIKYVIRK